MIAHGGAGRVSLGVAHEIGLCASLTSATLIVLLGGEFPPWVWLAAFAPILSMAMTRRGYVVPGFTGTLLALAATGAGVATLVRGGIESAVFAGGATLLGLLAARVLTRRTLTHDLQAILLSLVLVLAGSVLNVGLSYFLVFVAYALSTVWALATRQLLAGAEQAGASSRAARARDDVITPLFFAASGAVSLGVLAAAILVFVSFPRIGFGELGFLSRRESKLPPSVGFGGDPRGRSTSTDVVARLRGVPMDAVVDGVYLRAIVYDEISLDAFAQSAPDATEAPVIDTRPAVTSLAHDPSRAARVEVTLAPVGGALIFTIGHTRTAQALGGGAANPNRSVAIAGRDRHDELRASVGLSSPLRYELRGSIAAPGRVPSPPHTPPQLLERDRFLEVPANLDPRVRALVDEALGEDPRALADEEKAARLRAWFARRFRYSLEGEVAGASAPLQAFLLTARAGHCELFAGGFALLLRLAGVPARVVGGFQGGALADDGALVFQQRHAHAWVEWWKDGVGWIVDDATPEPGAARERLRGIDGVIEAIRRFWDDRVLDYALQDQQDALRAITQALRGKNLGKLAKGLVVAVVVVGVAVALLRRARGRLAGAGRTDRLAGEILAAIERLTGRPPPTTMTLRELCAGLDHAVLRDAVDVCERSRFGGERFPVGRIDGLVAALRALRRRA